MRKYLMIVPEATDEPRLLTDLDRQFGENFARARAQCQALVRGWMDLARTA